VFPSPRNTTAAAINPRKAWAAVLIRAGLADVRLHDLRRTLGVWAARGGANAAQIQALLGHRDRRSSEVYSWLAGDAGEAGAAVGRLASKALGL
jgi:integrase